jgi:membrane fusion protein (multidrug efflux system)
MKRPGTWKIGAGSLVVVALAAVGWRGTAARGSGGPRPADRSVKTVAALRVREAQVSRTISLLGEVAGLRQTLISAKTSGFLKSVAADRGDQVVRGHLLALIVSPENDQEVSARAADLDGKRRKARRFRELADKGIVSQQELERAAADEDMAASELARAGALRGYQVIRAPFSGTITARFVDEGTLVQAAAGSPLFELADLSRVRVRLAIPEEHAHQAVQGTEVVLWSRGDSAPRRARIARAARRIDPASRTMAAEVDLDNPEAAFFPGESLRATLELAPARQMLIPPEALMLRGGKTAVAVVEAGRARFVSVQLGEHQGTAIEVRKGLREGEVVAVNVGDDLNPGDPVSAQIR